MEENKEVAGQNQQNESGKDKKKFEDALSLFWAILGKSGKPLTKKKKASTSLVDKVVDELAKESDEKFEKELKEEITKSIEAFNTYQRLREEKLKEFEKADNEAMKQFTATAQRLAQKIENQAEIRQRYAKSVEALGNAASSETN